MVLEWKLKQFHMITLTFGKFAGNITSRGMGPTCFHRAIAKHTGIIGMDEKIIIVAETSEIPEESKKQMYFGLKKTLSVQHGLVKV